MCDVLVLDSHCLRGAAHCFTVQFHPPSAASDITAVEKDPWPCMTRGHISSDYIMEKSPAVAHDVSGQFGFRSGRTLSTRVAAFFFFFPLQPTFGLCFCSIPLSAFIHPVILAAGLPSARSALLAVLTVSCGLQGCWDGLHVESGGDGGR